MPKKKLKSKYQCLACGTPGRALLEISALLILEISLLLLFVFTPRSVVSGGSQMEPFIQSYATYARLFDMPSASEHRTFDYLLNQGRVSATFQQTKQGS